MSNSFEKLNQIKGLKNGKGIQYLLSEVYKIMGNPTLIHDMEYKIIELNENVVTDDPIWIEYADKGTVGYEWLDFFKNECFIETAANAKKITFLTSDKLKYNRIFGKIFNKNNIQIGSACMLACDKPFEDGDAELFDAVCSVLSAEFGRSRFFTDYGQMYLEKLVSELISGISDKELYSAHVESIYMHLKTNIYLAAAEINPEDSQKLVQLKGLFRKTQPEYIYAAYSGYILIILSTDNAELDVEKDLRRLNRVFVKNDVKAGISSCFDNLFELYKYYDEAILALKNGDGSRISLFDKRNKNSR